MSWVAIATAAVTVGTTVYSAKQNKKAAATAAAGQKEAAATANEAIDKQIAAMKQGIAEADTLYGDIRTQTQPGVTHLRDVVAAPVGLTPDQVEARDDLRRRVENSNQVAGSALRGSGRSFVDAMRAVEGSFTNTALKQNRDRQDAAATQLANPNFNAAGNQAGAHATLGQQVGGALASQGANTAGAISDAATTNANAQLANAGLATNAASDIAGAIAAQVKDQNRPGKYATYNPSTQTYTPGPEGFQ